MISRRTVRAIVAIAAASIAATAVTWWQSPDGVPIWLRRTALVAIAVALLATLVNVDTRPRLMLRFVSALFFLIAVIALAADWTRSPDSQITGAASLLDHLTVLTPSIVSSMQSTLSSSISPSLWDPVMTSVLGLPAWVIFTALALGSAIAGRPRREARIFAN
jgi:hypothetical protein